MKRLIWTIIITIVTITVFTSCYGITDIIWHQVDNTRTMQVAWSEKKGTAYTDLAYGDGQYNRYNLYVPADKSAPQSRHLLLFIHGGSWSGGRKEEGDALCRYMCCEGYVTATIGYTLYDKNNSTSILGINGEVALCVEEIRNKVAELGIELEDMAVGGFSAGACQALLYGFKERTDSALEVKFIFAESGPVTFEPSRWNVQSGANETILKLSGFDGTDEGAARLLSRFSGKNVTVQMVKDGTYKPIADEMSPLSYIDGSSVPVLLAYGRLDGLVPRVHKNLLMAKLDEKSVHYDYVEFPDSGHNLIYDEKERKLYLELLKQYCISYFGI